MTEDPSIFEDYAELERFAWQMHGLLTRISEEEKRDPDHLFDLPRMRRLGEIDGVTRAFKDWAK